MSETSARTVTVGCKLPNGLILRNYRMEEFNEPVMGGGSRKGKRAIQVGGDVKLRGFSVPVLGKAPAGHELAGGHALTHGVPADFWEQWVKDNKESPLVKNGIVFAHAEAASVVAFANEREREMVGLEPLDMTPRSERGETIPNDPRAPRKIAKGEAN